MIARCVRTSLEAPERGHFYTAQTNFHVQLGKDYLVLGICLWETILIVLMCDETGRPRWHPIGLFEFDHEKLPEDWEFSLLDGIAASGGNALNRRVAIWGYRELVREPQHVDKLVDRDPAALEVFFRELRAAQLKFGIT
jgi:hypothetical protein